MGNIVSSQSSLERRLPPTGERAETRDLGRKRKTKSGRKGRGWGRPGTLTGPRDLQRDTHLVTSRTDDVIHV